jgi:steroid delta-isomerase
MSLLDREVAAFNEGVRTGDWSSLAELFTDGAELEFVGIPVGPFHGRAAIEKAYRAQPPDDEIVVLQDRGDSAVYAWSRDPERPAGELHLEERDGAIARLRVLYETFT